MNSSFLAPGKYLLTEKVGKKMFESIFRQTRNKKLVAK